MSTDEAVREAPGLEALEDALGHRFRDRSLLETALTHASYSNEKERVHAKASAGKPSGREPSEREPSEREASAGETKDNERLEFLGDSVVGMVAADLLYRAHPSWREGELTRALHQLVDRRGLSRLARELDLGAWLRLGRTELRSAGHQKSTILADAMEAVLGALFLDGGLEPVRRFVARAFASALAVDAPRVDLDPKTRFQEWVMERFGVFPFYRSVGDSGVEGDEERFTVEALIRDEPVARGTARSKRIAERRAAEDAYARRAEIARWVGEAASTEPGDV